MKNWKWKNVLCKNVLFATKTTSHSAQISDDWAVELCNNSPGQTGFILVDPSCTSERPWHSITVNNLSYSLKQHSPVYVRSLSPAHLLNFCHVLCWPAEEQSEHACSTCRRNWEILSSQFSKRKQKTRNFGERCWSF